MDNKSKKKGDRGGLISVYRHYRTGKVMRARDYGYKARPFGPRKKKAS